jgi:hypothetical protein
MHSKYKIWDYLNQFEKINNGLSNISYYVEDPFFERMLIAKWNAEKQHEIYFGNEINREFVENKFLNLSLFDVLIENNNNEIILFIFSAELIEVKVLDFLIEQLAINPKKEMVLIFNKKLTKSVLDLHKKNKMQLIEIEEIKFWEGSQTLLTVANFLNFKIPNDIFQYVLANFENSVESFWNLVQSMKLMADEETLTLVKFKEINSREKYDFFEIVEIYHRNKGLFFNTILEKKFDFDWFITFIISFENHLLKVLSPSNVSGKLSRYDQNILDWNKKESRKILLDELHLFMELEILAKSRDELMFDKLKLRKLSF